MVCAGSRLFYCMACSIWCDITLTLGAKSYGTSLGREIMNRATADSRVVAMGAPVSQAPERSPLRAVAVRRCCNWDLATPQERERRSLQMRSAWT